MASLDAHLCGALTKPKPMPPRHAAYKGEVARGTLRDAKRACSTQELTMH
jgi:hypothetical protein